MGFTGDIYALNHPKLSGFETYLKKEGKEGWYFVGSWEHLNKIPINDIGHLLEFVKNTFGIEL